MFVCLFLVSGFITLAWGGGEGGNHCPEAQTTHRAEYGQHTYIDCTCGYHQS